MKQELIIASFFTIISFNISAQDNISGQEDNKARTGIKEPVTENKLIGMYENKLSIKVTARETPSCPGKGAIVSNQAKQLGYTKRHKKNSLNVTVSNKGSQNCNRNRSRMQMQASPFRQNPALIAHNAMRGAQRNGLHGKK